MSEPVLVLAGGLSPERDVSVRSGRRTAEALRGAGVETVVSDVDSSLLQRLTETSPACVIPMLHGAAGEDGALRDILATVGTPFVGSAADPCRLAFDKPVAKALMRRAGILTPASVALPHSAFRELGAPGLLDAVVARLGLPLIIKPTRGGSALGTSLVSDASELPGAMVGAFAYGESVLIEQYISGTELAVSIIESEAGQPRALPAVEIIPPGDGVYDYTSRYTAGTTEFFAPARIDEAVAESAADVALTAHRTLGLRDLSRVDLIADDAGRVWFLEVNTAPGMTETSLFPQACAAAGEDLGDLLRGLVETAMVRG